jgi:hypothetical protein
MMWLIWIVGVVVGLIMFIVIIGFMLPQDHRATASAPINAPPEAVFATITNWQEFPTWRSGLKSISPREGGGWIETGSNGVIPFEIVERMAPSRLVTKIADPKLPFGGTWSWTIAPDGDGCVVTIAEDGEVYNPFFRFMSRFVFGYEATMRTVLSDLRRKFERSGSSRARSEPASTLST